MVYTPEVRVKHRVWVACTRDMLVEQRVFLFVACAPEMPRGCGDSWKKHRNDFLQALRSIDVAPIKEQLTMRPFPFGRRLGRTKVPRKVFTILFKISTRMKLLFSNDLGDYSYSFEGSLELTNITVTVSLFL